MDKFTLKLPPRPEYISIVRLTASGILSKCEATIEHLEDIKLAVSEACIQVLDSNIDGDMIIEFTADCHRVIVCVKGFEGELPIENLEPEREMGRLIIDTLMDDVQYKSGELILKKDFG